MNNFEIELRYEILDVTQLSQFIVPFIHLHKKHDVDIYLDNPQAQFYQKGIFIRIRNNKKLEIKFNRACLDNPKLAIQDYCEEHTFALPLKTEDLKRLNELLLSIYLKPLHEASLECLKVTNTLDPYYSVDKIRNSYSYKDFTICIDEVLNLGIFLEIECMASSTQQLEIVKVHMQKLVNNLSLRPLKTGYGTLLLRKNHFQEYLKGRFILDEDCINY